MKLIFTISLILAFALQAEAARRWFVQTSDNKIFRFTEDDNAPTPDGTTAVTDATIRAADPPGATGDITPLGTWDGTTYTAPSGGGMNPPPYDPTTDSGMVKDSCNVMLDVFDSALVFIQDNQLAWRDDTRAKAVEGIHWQIINSARVALNSTRTHARRQKFCEESASWPMGVNGNVLDYVDAISADTSGTTPTKDWSWVNPEADPYTRVAVSGASTQFGSATNVEDAPSSKKLLGGAWIENIP